MVDVVSLRYWNLFLLNGKVGTRHTSDYIPEKILVAGHVAPSITEAILTSVHPKSFTARQVSFTTSHFCLRHYIDPYSMVYLFWEIFRPGLGGWDTRSSGEMHFAQTADLS